jgi:hypothetical protein
VDKLSASTGRGLQMLALAVCAIVAGCSGRRLASSEYQVTCSDACRKAKSRRNREDRR